MTLDSKIASVRKLLEEHNAIVLPSGILPTEQKDWPAGYVQIDQFFNNLRAMGATNEGALRQMSHEEIIE